jgi:hypothetical protein
MQLSAQEQKMTGMRNILGAELLHRKEWVGFSVEERTADLGS